LIAGLTGSLYRLRVLPAVPVSLMFGCDTRSLM
jgi:hypothetical protein